MLFSDERVQNLFHLVEKEALAVRQKPRRMTYKQYDYVLLDDTSIKIVNYRGNESKIEIPSIIDGKEVQVIGANSFEVKQYRENVTEIIIPDTVLAIEGSAFWGYHKLVSVKFSSNLLYIGLSAFSLCSSLGHVDIPPSVIAINGNPFGGCDELSSIELNENQLFDLREGVLYSKVNNGLICYPGALNNNSFMVSEAVAEIEAEAFLGNEKLSSIKVRDGTKKIGESAFQDCSELTSIELSETIEEIGQYAFARCDKLRKVILPPKVQVLKKGVFSCSSIEQIILPKELTKIESEVFFECESLNELHLNNNIKEIDALAFQNSGIISLSISPNNPYYYIDNNVLYGTNKSLVYYPSNNLQSDYIIKPGTIEICKNAFLDCCHLKSIQIPESVRKINSLFDVVYSDTWIVKGNYRDNINVIVVRDSYAEQYCIVNNLRFSYLV